MASLVIIGLYAAVLVIGAYFLQRALKWLKWRSKVVKIIEPLPGPPSIPILGCAHLFKWNSVEFTHQIEEWGREYALGHVDECLGMLKVFVGPVPLVFCSSHESIKPILESNTLISKPDQYDIISDWIGTGLLTSTNEKWFKRRKLLTPAFHFTILQGYVTVFAKQADVFVKQLGVESNTDNTFDLFPYIKRCALDIICGIGFEFNRLVKLTNDFTRRVIAERKASLDERTASAKSDGGEQKQRLAFLDMLLQMQRENQLSDEDIREEVDTFMFEGHDTTSSAMGFSIWFIGADPVVQEKVHAEVDEIFGDSDRLPDAEDLKRLDYLEMCVKEALRLMPSVPFIARRMSHDLKINDRLTLPEGMTVVLATIGTSRDPRIYDNPDNFNPDNFLPEAQSKRNPYTFVPFSAGPRNCIGQKFALFEEKIVLSSFFRKYRVETMEPWPNNRPVPEIILKPSNGFKVRIYSRQS